MEKTAGEKPARSSNDGGKKEEEEISGGSSDTDLTLDDVGEMIEIDAYEEVVDMEGGVEQSEVCTTPSVEDMSHDDNDRHIEEFLRNMNESNSRYDWTTLAIRAGITTILYPTQMAQMMMQVGYEPFPPRRSVTLLGRPCLLLPSTGGYLKYIYQVDGIRGIFRGLTPRIAQQLMFTYSFDTVRCQFRNMHVRYLVSKVRAKREGPVSIEGPLRTDHGDDSEQSYSETAGFFDHFREVIHDLMSKLAAIVVSYPMHVVVVRTIAHFIGREHCIRRGIFGEIHAIYADFGIMGFYRGLVPKLIGETCQTLAVAALAFFVSNQAPGAEIRSLLNVSFSILVSAWTYQFSVVSTTMAVNGSCLKIGRPPLQPVYDNWVECWKELGKHNLLNRGSSIICRYYTGPTLLVNGFREPIGMHFGPDHLSLSSAAAQEEVVRNCVSKTLIDISCILSTDRGRFVASFIFLVPCFVFTIVT